MGSTNGDNLACFGGTAEMDRTSLVKAPLLDESDAQTAYDMVLSGRIEPINGPHNLALAGEWADRFGTRHCLPTWSGMAALEVALIAAGIGPGDDVLVPALTFTATASAVINVGAWPIYVDVLPYTFEIDITDAQRKRTPLTRAIIPVHCHGLPCDMDRVSDFARAHVLVLIEDAAPAPGATFDGMEMGSWGLASIFSNSHGKPVMGGAGGLLITDDEETWKRVVRFARQGEDRPARPLQPHEHRAYRCMTTPCGNVRMPEGTAALVRGQLARLGGYLQRSRENAAVLTEALSQVPGLIPPYVPQGRESAWTYYRVRLDLDALGWSGDPVHARDNVIRALFAEGVPVTTWLLAGLDRQPGLRQRHNGTLRPIDPQSCPVTQRVLDDSFILGAAPYMLQVQTREAIESIIHAVQKVFEPGAIKRVLKDEHHPLTVVPAAAQDA
jgi:dTDP-4-amino-4,6-dideoxygalactose transaminase